MKNSNLIIKIAVGVSAVAALFSIVTLIRSIVIHSAIVLPIIQVAGSAAIFAVCVLMLRSLSVPVEDEEDDASGDDAQDENDAPQEEPLSDATQEAERAVDELFEKYDLSNFEE